jgi:ribokinase
VTPAPQVVVFGSVNMDLVARVPRFPDAGETLIGDAFSTLPGGKGANQAVAAARLGVQVRMVGRVGQDAFGQALLSALRGQGVNTDGVAVVPGSSGVAVIEVEAGGENRIVVIPGANGTAGTADLARLDAALDGAGVLLLQLEVPLPAVLAAARLAHARGVRVILDPAPARALPAELYALTDLLTPNESETATLVGFPVRTAKDVAHAARELLSRGVREVLIKRGASGAFWMNGEMARAFPAFPVRALDTVAAGDAFNGGLAAALGEGRPMTEAIRWASATGAISVTRPGAQSSLPSRAEVLALLDGAPFP